MDRVAQALAPASVVLLRRLRVPVALPQASLFCGPKLALRQPVRSLLERGLLLRAWTRRAGRADAHLVLARYVAKLTPLLLATDLRPLLPLRAQGLQLLLGHDRLGLGASSVSRVCLVLGLRARRLARQLGRWFGTVMVGGCGLVGALGGAHVRALANGRVPTGHRHHHTLRVRLS